MLQEALSIFNSDIRKSALPNLACVSMLFLKPIRKSAFNELYGLLDRHVLINRDQQMNVIGHHHKIVHTEFPG